jgi:hypothetical protein
MICVVTTIFWLVSTEVEYNEIQEAGSTEFLCMELLLCDMLEWLSELSGNHNMKPNLFF